MPKILRSKLFWAVAIPVALLGLYALLGFKVAPQVARDQAQAFVREHYARELTVGAITVHPFDDGRPVGRLLARSNRSDVVDAHLVLCAARIGHDASPGLSLGPSTSTPPIPTL